MLNPLSSLVVNGIFTKIHNHFDDKNSVLRTHVYNVKHLSNFASPTSVCLIKKHQIQFLLQNNALNQNFFFHSELVTMLVRFNLSNQIKYTFNSSDLYLHKTFDNDVKLFNCTLLWKNNSRFTSYITHLVLCWIYLYSINTSWY